MNPFSSQFDQCRTLRSLLTAGMFRLMKHPAVRSQSRDRRRPWIAAPPAARHRSGRWRRLLGAAARIAWWCRLLRAAMGRARQYSDDPSLCVQRREANGAMDAIRFHGKGRLRVKLIGQYLLDQLSSLPAALGLGTQRRHPARFPSNRDEARACHSLTKSLCASGR